MGGREERPGQTAAQIRSDGQQLQLRRPSKLPSPGPAAAMDSRAAFLALLLLLGTLRAGDGKPISLTYRCPCRFFESNVAKSHVRHLKILTVPGCSLQVIARLKNSGKQICVDPKLKWIQEFLEKYMHKRLKM